MVRLNLFSKKNQENQEATTKTAEPKTETQHVEPVVPEPPKFKDTPPTQVQVQYVEREITLSTLNDKLNYLTTRFEEFLEAISKKEE
jgi:hypothetical protein